MKGLLKHMTGPNEGERQYRRVVLAAVAAGCVELGDQSGMGRKVSEELGLPGRYANSPYDAAAKQREKFDLQAALGKGLSVGEVVVVCGEIGKLLSMNGGKGIVEFEVETNGEAHIWTGEYAPHFIHRDPVSLRSPGRAMRSDALELGGATIADTDAHWRHVCLTSPGSKGLRRRRTAPSQHEERQTQVKS